MLENKSLVNLKVGDSARVAGLRSAGAMRRRLQDLGIVEGTRIQCTQKSPSGDPTAYAVRGAIIALRREDAQNVVVDQVRERISATKAVQKVAMC